MKKRAIHGKRKKPGVRRDSPLWFQHQLNPIPSTRALARIMVGQGVCSTQAYGQKMLWYAFNKRQITPDNLRRTIGAVEAFLRSCELSELERETLLESLRKAITPRQLTTNLNAPR